MKKVKYSLFLLPLLALSSCSEDKMSEILYSSNEVDCITQVSKSCDTSEYVDIIERSNQAFKSEDNYEYKMEFNENISVDMISCYKGLEGKNIDYVRYIDSHHVAVGLSGTVLDETATFGFIKFSEESFTPLKESLKGDDLLCKVRIGDNYQIDVPHIY